MKTIFTTSLFFIFFLCAMKINAQIGIDGLIAYYPFSGNANDSSGNGNNGTVNSAVLTTDRFGNANHAYLFNGSSSYIQVPSSPSLESNRTTNQITEAAWIYLKGESAGNTFPRGPITQKTASSFGQYTYRMYVNPGQSSAQGAIGQGYTDYTLGEHVSSYTFNLNEWYFVATTFNSATGKIAKSFVNGVRLDSSILNIDLIQNNSPLTIGKDPDEISEYFNGIIDELSIYNRALSDSEIQVLFNSSTLPLHFISFQASQKAKSVELNWHTENEINTERFEIERALSNNNFKGVGAMKSYNKSSNDYVYNDNIENLESTTMNYRLKQVDKDGKFTYSKVVRVKIINTTMAKIFPNPATATATISLQSDRAESVMIKIASSDGKIVSSKTYNLTTGINQILLQTERLAFGAYTVVITRQNINERLTFSKQ